jgi:P27 family predicted phage terminase small subunit
MKGRKPNLTVIEGGKARAKTPAAPAWLSEEAKAEWKRAAPQLGARKLLTPDMLATLESYCVAVGIVRETETIMQADGRLVTVNGVSKTHPAFKMQSGAMREARLLAAELGLTPHRRGLKGKDDGKQIDGWADDLLA